MFQLRRLLTIPCPSLQCLPTALQRTASVYTSVGVGVGGRYPSSLTNSITSSTTNFITTTFAVSFSCSSSPAAGKSPKKPVWAKKYSPEAAAGHVTIGFYKSKEGQLEDLCSIYKKCAIDPVLVDQELSRYLVSWQLCPDEEKNQLVSISTWTSWAECKHVMDSDVFIKAIGAATQQLVPMLTEPPTYLDLPSSFSTH